MVSPFRKGEFAILQGQIVEIIEIIPIVSKYWPDEYNYKVKLLNDNLTHKVHKSQLVKTNNQIAPRILFKKS